MGVNWFYRSDGKPDYRAAALGWRNFGFDVIPLIPGQKRTAVRWNPWLQDLDEANVRAYWLENPDHEVGFIVSDRVIVLDADSPSAVAQIYEIEEAFDITPTLVVTTSKGEHHYFRLRLGTVVRNSSFSTEQHPERIDVKVKRSNVVLPPSTGKTIRYIETDNISGLTEVGQDFIDAVFVHNGQQPPRSPAPRTESNPIQGNDQATEVARVLLNVLDPDESYDNWLHCGMALYHETDGSEEGYRLWDVWSATGDKYKGPQETRTKWESFGNYPGVPITLGSLKHMVAQKGIDVRELLEPQFVPTTTETVLEDLESERKKRSSGISTAVHPLLPFSLTGQSERLRQEIREQVFVLDDIALRAQYTAIYAPPNMGKTLLVLHMLLDSVTAGRIEGSSIFYINVDDNSAGLIDKLTIVEKFGIHMIAAGYADFTESKLVAAVRELITQDQARGTVIILDTIKKFTNIMEKVATSNFNREMRHFVLKGGTVIVLGHTNKNRGQDGKVVHGGTSDILDDADCVYTLDVLKMDEVTETRTVEFENLKRRGDVVNQVAYSYSTARGLSYGALLDSVVKIEDPAAESLRKSVRTASDQAVIDAITTAIRDGNNKRMVLIKDVAASIDGISQAMVRDVLDRYDGSDPSRHLWSHIVGPRGAKIYSLLQPPAA